MGKDKSDNSLNSMKKNSDHEKILQFLPNTNTSKLLLRGGF
jgi:hypothetical protein